MPDEYSLYEAKAKLSALVKQVREGRTVVITVHGQPAAELRPIDPTRAPQSLAQRLEELAARGVLLPAPKPAGRAASMPVGAKRAGALRRFLEDRA